MDQTTSRFPVTRHSVIAAVQGGNSFEKSKALEVFIAAYWKPVYKYLRLRWNLDAADAQDLTQEFFTRLLEKDFLDGYAAAKGRLRTFLRTCADRVVLKQWRDAHRLKRDEAQTVHLAFDQAERELVHGALLNADTIDQYLERERIRSLFTLALERLRHKCEHSGKIVHLALFERYDLAEDEAEKPSYAQLAAEFALPITAVTNYLAWDRREFRQCVLDQLREMTASEEEFQRESRSLFGTSTK
jgi:RNA polymerase sigma factor (sigma-70 family)